MIKLHLNLVLLVMRYQILLKYSQIFSVHVIPYLCNKKACPS